MPTEHEERARKASAKLEQIKTVKTTSKWVPKPTIQLVEKVRGKLKQKAKELRDGQTLEELLCTFDADNSGQLDGDEVRKTFRTILNITKDAVFDQEIASL